MTTEEGLTELTPSPPVTTQYLNVKAWASKPVRKQQRTIDYLNNLTTDEIPVVVNTLTRKTVGRQTIINSPVVVRAMTAGWRKAQKAGSQVVEGQRTRSAGSQNLTHRPRVVLQKCRNR